VTGPRLVVSPNVLADDHRPTGPRRKSRFAPAVTSRFTVGERPLGGLTPAGVSDTGVVLASLSADDPSAWSQEGPFVGTRVTAAAVPAQGTPRGP